MKKMTRVNFKFSRTGKFNMIGECSVDVENPNDIDEILARASELDFSSFRPTDLDFDEEEWGYFDIPVEDDED